MTKPIVSVTTPTGPIVDPKTGQATFAFIKWLQGIGTTINQAFDQQGALSPDSVPYPTANTLGGVQTAGPIGSQWINEIDGEGVPHLTQPGFSDLGGKATAGQVPALSQLQGSVTVSQVPPLSQLQGAVTPSQVPALSELNGQITEAQEPSGGISVTITTAQLTPLTGTQGSMTFVNGRLTAQVQAT